MIQIENSNPSLVREWCEIIYKKMSFPRKYKGQGTFKEDISNWIRSHLIIEGISWVSGDDVFLQLMTLEYPALEKIAKWFDATTKYSDRIPSKDWIFHPECKKLIGFQQFEACLRSAYNFVEKENRYAKVNITDIQVCPYCNRNYIYSIINLYSCQYCKNDDSIDNHEHVIEKLTLKQCPNSHDIDQSKIELINICELDHFWSQSKYPILAVCFYNLVPSCASCNHLKSDKEFHVSPYDSSIDSDELFSFNYDLEAIDKPKLFLEKKKAEKFELFKRDFDTIALGGLYQTHLDVVKELLWKKEIYSKTYQNKINQLFTDKHFSALTQSDFNRIITGVYTDPKDYSKRPLSKLVTDISRQIGLIGEEG